MGPLERPAPSSDESVAFRVALQRRVERVLVKHVDEAIAQREGVVGKLGFARELHEGVYALQLFEPVLDLVGRKVQHLGR